VRFDVATIDPPWRFNNIKTGGSFKSGAEQVYTTQDENEGRSTMALEEIKALPIQTVLEDNAIAGVWVPTALKFSHAYPCLRAWELTYRTTWYWRKTRMGMGFWGRNIVEEFLICTRGHVTPPALAAGFTGTPNAVEAPETGNVTWFDDPDMAVAMHARGWAVGFGTGPHGERFWSEPVEPMLDRTLWVTVPAGEHSRKPAIFRTMLEQATKGIAHESRRHQVEIFARELVPGWTGIGNDVCPGEDIRTSIRRLYLTDQQENVTA